MDFRLVRTTATQRMLPFFIRLNSFISLFRFHFEILQLALQLIRRFHDM